MLRSFYRGEISQLVVSVVGNGPAALFGPISKMQEMTSDICSEIGSGTEGTLIDSRDGTIYHVGKMKDGKCWMLQNLALGSSSSSTALSSTDSNITADSWTLPKSYTSATSGSHANTTVESWNFGKWVLATPLKAESCGDGISSLTSCTRVGFVDVSDSSKFQPTYTAATGTWDGANANSSTLVAVNCISWSGTGTSKICTAGTYDPRYLVGNYYSWNTATAGTGGTIVYERASGSICPKGWELPIAANKTSGAFKTLTNAYGVSSSVSGTTYNIAGSPLRFVRGGSVDPGNYIYAGSYGVYWSSMASSTTGYSYRLFFNDSSVTPSNDNSKYNGCSVRCVAE